MTPSGSHIASFPKNRLLPPCWLPPASFLLSLLLPDVTLPSETPSCTAARAHPSYTPAQAAILKRRAACNPVTWPETIDVLPTRFPSLSFPPIEGRDTEKPFQEREAVPFFARERWSAILLLHLHPFPDSFIDYGNLIA